jgi:hypothetical protein
MNKPTSYTAQTNVQTSALTSFAGKQGAEELVSSRYALKVGEIEVLVVSDGVLPLPTETLATNAAPEVRAAWLQDMFLPPDAFDWPLNVLVVRSGDQTILVDAGLGGQFPRLPARRHVPQAAGGRRHRPGIRDRHRDHPHAHGPCRRAARRRA